MKKLITICAVAAMTSTAYALPSDDFNDNSMNMSLWSVFQESPNVWLSETTERLEVRSLVSTDGGVALYLANGWGISTAESFSFKVDFYCSPPLWPGFYEFGAMIGLGKGYNLETIGNNNATIDASSYSDAYEIGMSFTSDKTTEGDHMMIGQKTRSQERGVLYISYDASKDELYLSDAGYWEADAWVAIPGLLRGEWGSAFVKPFIGSSFVLNVSLDPGDAYLDNFVIDSGTIIRLCEYMLSGDLNDDCRIDFYDFAVMASNWLIDCTTDPSNLQCVHK